MNIQKMLQQAQRMPGRSRIDDRQVIAGAGDFGGDLDDRGELIEARRSQIHEAVHDGSIVTDSEGTLTGEAIE